MAIISYDFGHMEGGQDASANGILYEYKINRDYGEVTVDELTKAGHTLVNCTPSNGNMTLMESLAYRVNKANASGSVLHLCFHANAFDGNAYGAEVEVASDNGIKYGQSILNEICKLGFSNRGVKRPSLYITKNTNMTAVLIEPFFCDNQSDCNKYNPQTLGKSIAKGVMNILGGNVIPQPINTDYDHSIPTGDNIHMIGKFAYIEETPDGRLIIHNDKANYITLGKGFSDVYWNDGKGNKGSKRLNN